MITVMRVCFFAMSISLMASLVAISLANNSLAKPTEASLSLHQVGQPSSSPCSTSGDPPDGRPNIESSFSVDSAPLIPNEPPSSTTTTLSTTPSAGTSSTTAGRHNSQSSSSLCPSNSHTSLSLPLKSPISSSSRPFHANSNSISISNSNSNSMQPQNTLMHDQALRRRFVTINQPIPSDHHVIDMEQRANNQPASADLTDNNNRPVMLGETFLELTFQAVLGLMVFRFQGPSSSSSSSFNNVHERTLAIVEASMVVGFTGTLTGILLRPAYPLKARYIENAGAFVAAFGFLGMATMFLPDNVHWIVWPAGLLLLAGFLLALFK